MVKRETQIKRMRPRAGEANHIGYEPEWAEQPSPERRISAMSSAFQWYNYNFGKKEAKDVLVQYLEIKERAKDAKRIRSLPDSQIRTTTAWAARMNLLGLEFTPQEAEKIEGYIAEMLTAKQEDVAEDVEPAVPKLTIQDHLRERISECAGEMEGLFDDFVVNGAKLNADYKPIGLLRSMNVAPQLIHMITRVWQLRLLEYTSVLDGNDRDLIEAYSHLSKAQLKSCVKFCELVINDCASYVQVKKTERKPRAKKAVNPEKLASKFKYLKEFAEFKLKSESPVKLVGATEAWLYETTKRKLIHVIADSHAGSFTIKGSSLVGFDAVQTVQKTLRKPAEQLKAITAAGKPAARKLFKDISSVEIKWTGRGNENLVILKAW